MSEPTLQSSKRARQVMQWFGLPRIDQTLYRESSNRNQISPPQSGKIILITGPSGAGKSSLLRNLRPGLRDVIDLNELILPQLALVDCFDSLSLTKTLSLLSRAGLAEAWSYLKTPVQLSDGQRWRLRLAIALHKASAMRNPTIVCDEFAALLDRVTASVVARSVRKIIDESRESKNPLRAILVTSHEDLLRSLQPDLHVTCDFGSMRIARRAKIKSFTKMPPPIAKARSAPARRR